MIKGAQKKSAQIRWIFIVSLSLIAMGLSHETWGAAGQVFISAPASVGTVEVAGDFVIEGTFLMTEDDTPTGEGYWESCESRWPSQNGRAAFSPDYWDTIWWDGTHAELYVLIDRDWSPLMQPITRVRYWSARMRAVI